MGGQLRLKLEQSADFSRNRFVVSAPNLEAVQTLDVWPNEQGGILALIGPPGAGKTHLSMAWAARTGAEIVTFADSGPDQDDPPRALLLEEADVAPHDEAFFHLLNKASRSGRALLMTGRTPPKTWSVDVEDLRSRLNAIPLIELGEPDDVILRGVLVKLFQERNIRPPLDLLAYLVLRMERSVPAAQTVVAALDEQASARHRAVSRALAREILQDDADDSIGDG